MVIVGFLCGYSFVEEAAVEEEACVRLLWDLDPFWGYLLVQERFDG